MATGVEISPELRSLCVKTIQMLSADAVQQANSGHPGTPLGAADMAFVLWTEFLRYHPQQPDWPGRDRFILSPGHAGMLHYSLLHLSGYDLSLEDIRRFRQLGSKTPGHPEYGLTPGIEVTTGPLGQGFGHGVGMAIAAHALAAKYGTSGFSPADHYIYGIVSDGDLQEGISYEAASLAGHLGLGRLIYVYDCNKISIEGSTEITWTEDVRQRFAAMGWHVDEVDGYDHDAIRRSLRGAQAVTDRPSLIISHSEIGRGAPTLHGSEKTHGNPLGVDELKRTKEALGWPQEPWFQVPTAVQEYFASLSAARGSEYDQWQAAYSRWQAEHPALAAQWEAGQRQAVPADLDEQLLGAVSGATGATRSLSGKVIQKAAAALPYLIGGSADLGPSTDTDIIGGGHLGPAAGPHATAAGPAGRTIHYGVREHAMGDVINGVTLHGGLRCYGATFLTFSDYMRPPIRLAALMEIPSIFIFTHDSIFLGEDGPTHQPIEHLWVLRAVPHLTLFRPADAVEVAMAWSWVLQAAHGPAALVFTRQKLPAIARPAGFEPRDVWRGGYVLAEAESGPADATLIATGSELSLAVAARDALAARGLRLRLVSMPSVELFERQDAAYKQQVLGAGPVASLEAGVTQGWYRYVGRDGLAMGIDRFGASAPMGDLAERFGFTPAKVAGRIAAWLGR